MHWRSACALRITTASAGQHIVTRQMCDQARQRNPHVRLPNIAARLGLHRIPVVNIMRQELNQIRWDIRKHDYKVIRCLCVVFVLLMIAGFVEQMA
jgi:type VI protein secretion system component VasA